MDSASDNKQKILHELNTQLQIRAQKIRLKSRADYELSDEEENIDDDSQTPLDLLRMRMSPTPNTKQTPALIQKTSLKHTDEKSTKRTETSARQHNIVTFQIPDEMRTKQNEVNRKPSRIPTNSPRNIRIPASSPRSIRVPSTSPRNIVRPKQRANARRPYRPTYTWNMGGRVKELRIRCLARKFLFIWRKNTFGRVPLSRAIEHYKRKRLRECFSAWHGEWWEARKEWRLNVRAELHNRYRIWNKVWKVWRDYTVQHRVKTAKVKLANAHANKKLLHTMMESWKMYTHVRKTKADISQKARQVYEQNLARNAWLVWNQRLYVRRCEDEQEQIALQHWAHTLTHKAWRGWRRRIFEGRRQKESRQIAAKHDVIRLLWFCFNAWQQYTHDRQEKKVGYEHARKVHSYFVMRDFMHRWHKRYQQSVSIRQHEHQITEMGIRFHKRRLFEYWKFFIRLKYEKWEKERLAESFHRRTVLKAGFAAIKLNTVQKRIAVMKNNIALHFYQITIIKHAWNRWMEKCEEKEELHLIMKTRAARQHHNKVILMKMMDRWKQYAKWRNHRKNSYAYADEHYANQLIPKCLDRWQHFVQLQQHKRHLADQALEFRQENLQARFFYEWHTRYEKSQDVRLMERMAILHCDSTRLKSVFKLWRKKTQLRLEEQFKMEVAEDHYDVQIVKRAFKTWRNDVCLERKRCENEEKAEAHWRKTVLKDHFALLRKYVVHRNSKYVKQQRADAHLSKKLCTRTLCAWKRHTKWWREIHSFVALKQAEKNQLKLRWAFGEWYTNSQLQKLEKEKHSLAVTQHSNSLYFKVFEAWRLWAAKHAHKRQQKESCVQEARRQLQQGILKRAFEKWRRAKDNRILSRLRMEQAKQHYENMVKRKALQRWQLFKQICIRKELLKRQAQWFHDTRLVAKHFLTWQAVHTEAVIVNDKTNLALYQWSLTLEKKVLTAWIEYTDRKRQKRARIRDAMETRRLRLLRNGAAKWLQVSADLAGIRQRFAAQQGAETYYKIHKVVARCASHWRHFAAKRKAEKLAQQPRPLLYSASDSKIGRNAPRENKGNNTTVRKLVPSPSLSNASPARITWAKSVTSEPDRFDGGKGKRRNKPRHPSFLVDSLRREGLYTATVQSMQFTEPAEDVNDTPAHERTQQSASEFGRLESQSGSGENVEVHHHGQGHILKPPSRSKRQSQTKLGRNEENEDDMPSSVFPKHQDRMFGKAKETSTPRSLETEGHYAHQTGANNFIQLPVDDSQATHSGSDSDFRFKNSVLDNVQLDTSASEIESLAGVRDSGKRVKVQPEVRKMAAKIGDESVKLSVELMPPSAFMAKQFETPTTDISAISCPVSNLSGTIHQLDQRMTSHLSHDMHLTNSNVPFSSPAEELIYIKKRLSLFKENKEKLKLEREQFKQLNTWLLAQRDCNDSDYLMVKEEVHVLENDIKELSQNIQAEKSQVQYLAKRAKELISS